MPSPVHAELTGRLGSFSWNRRFQHTCRTRNSIDTKYPYTCLNHDFLHAAAIPPLVGIVSKACLKRPQIMPSQLRNQLLNIFNSPKLPLFCTNLDVKIPKISYLSCMHWATGSFCINQGSYFVSKAHVWQQVAVLWTWVGKVWVTWLKPLSDQKRLMTSIIEISLIALSFDSNMFTQSAPWPSVALLLNWRFMRLYFETGHETMFIDLNKIYSGLKWLFFNWDTITCTSGPNWDRIQKLSSDKTRIKFGV